MTPEERRARLEALDGKGGLIYQYTVWFVLNMIPMSRLQKEPEFRYRYLRNKPVVKKKWEEYCTLRKEWLALLQERKEGKI